MSAGQCPRTDDKDANSPRHKCSLGKFSLGTKSPLSAGGLPWSRSTSTMSYLHDHCSNDGVPSPSRTRRPTPAPPLKSVTGAKDRALDGSAMLRASAVAKRRGIDSSCFMFLLVLLARGVCLSLRPSIWGRGRAGERERELMFRCEVWPSLLQVR